MFKCFMQCMQHLSVAYNVCNITIHTYHIQKYVSAIFPYVLEGMWEFSGEFIQAVLCAAGGGMIDCRRPKVLGRLHWLQKIRVPFT